MYSFSKKSTDDLSLRKLKTNPKFKEKLTFYLKNNMTNLISFDSSSEKSQPLPFDGTFLSKVSDLWFRNLWYLTESNVNKSSLSNALAK